MKDKIYGIFHRNSRKITGVKNVNDKMQKFLYAREEINVGVHPHSGYDLTGKIEKMKLSGLPFSLHSPCTIFS